MISVNEGPQTEDLRTSALIWKNRSVLCYAVAVSLPDPGTAPDLKTLCTVKASNFGPLVNFGLFHQKRLLSSKRVLQKNEENDSFRKTSDLQTLFC